MNLKPAAAHLLINPISDEPPKSGIILAPKTVRAMSPYIRGVVIRRGKGTKAYPMHEFRNNESNGKEVVLFSRGAGTKIMDNGIEYRILHISDVIAYWDNAECQERDR